MTEIKVVRAEEKATEILRAIRLIDEGARLEPVVFCEECRWRGIRKSCKNKYGNHFCADGERNPEAYKGERDAAVWFRDRSKDSPMPGAKAMFQLAAEALEKQTPKAPIKDSLADRACPACDAYILFDALNDKPSDAPGFCKHCGQALKWEDTEYV